MRVLSTNLRAASARDHIRVGQSRFLDGVREGPPQRIALFPIIRFVVTTIACRLDSVVASARFGTGRVLNRTSWSACHTCSCRLRGDNRGPRGPGAVPVVPRLNFGAAGRRRPVPRRVPARKEDGGPPGPVPGPAQADGPASNRSSSQSSSMVFVLCVVLFTELGRRGGAGVGGAAGCPRALRC